MVDQIETIKYAKNVKRKGVLIGSSRGNAEMALLALFSYLRLWRNHKDGSIQEDGKELNPFQPDRLNPIHFDCAPL